MKKIAMICLFAAMAMVAGAQTGKSESEPAHGAKIRFESEVHEYGTVERNGNGDCQFVFWNDGDEPLILSKVTATCGCTTPHHTEQPVMPGQKGVIDVHYNTGIKGIFTKYVNVESNAVNKQRVSLRIHGEVVDPAGQNQAQPAKQQPAHGNRLTPTQAAEGNNR